MRKIDVESANKVKRTPNKSYVVVDQINHFYFAEVKTTAEILMKSITENPIESKRFECKFAGTTDSNGHLGLTEAIND